MSRHQRLQSIRKPWFRGESAPATGPFFDGFLGHLCRILLITVVVVGLAGCRSKRAPAPATSAPAPGVSVQAADAEETASAPQPQPIPTIPASAAPPTTETLLSLPTAFRYEVTSRQAGADGGQETIITGQYRAGDWAQIAQRTRTARTAGDAAGGEEAIVAGGLSYTRPAGQESWTRWPGAGFDAAYGLTAPFTVLRLYPIAEERTSGVLEPVPGAPEATFRVQTVVSGESVSRLLRAGINSLAVDEARRSAVETQIAPLGVQQTITYWVGEDGNIYQAAATLLVADDAGDAPKAWLEITWRFWDYDDPSILIVAPPAYRSAPGPETTAEPLPPTQPASRAVAGDNLIVRVYASAGVPADNLAVTVYPAGEARQPLDWRSDAESGFTLPPGNYDVLVQMDYAQEWLRGLTVSEDGLVSRDVAFDFGALELSITLDGEIIPVEVVTYPAEDRQNWLDWRSDNPATIRLRAGVYDVEIAYADYSGTEILTGLVVKAGETTVEEVVLEP